uniref:Exocyst complex component Sec8 n=1 Tax=Triticum urartu TaxID=4572 RepID=A0A8R7QZ06_TRIUA
MRLDPANASLQKSFGQLDNDIPDAGIEVEIELSDLLLDMCPIKQENLIHDDQKLILLASLSDSLEYLADSVERLGESFISPSTISENKSDIHQSHHTRTTSAIPKSLASLANEYRRLATDCVRVLRLEMQLETIYHMQEMTKREYVEDQDAEDPDDFIISLTTQVGQPTLVLLGMQLSIIRRQKPSYMHVQRRPKARMQKAKGHHKYNSN